MVTCYNRNTNEYQTLLAEFKTNIDTDNIINSWQKLTRTDEFPTVDEATNLLADRKVKFSLDKREFTKAIVANLSRLNIIHQYQGVYYLTRSLKGSLQTDPEVIKNNKARFDNYLSINNISNEAVTLEYTRLGYKVVVHDNIFTPIDILPESRLAKSPYSMEIMNHLQKLFPQIKIKVATPEVAKEYYDLLSDSMKAKLPFDKIKSFYIDGHAILIKGRVTLDTAIEEVLHPFTDALKIDNPQLFDSLYKDASKNFPELKQAIDDSYTIYRGFTDIDRQLELVTQALVRHFRNEYETKPTESFLNKIQQFLKWFASIVEKVHTFLTGSNIQETKTTEIQQETKPGVEELFDSNPELANAVYEALGFDKQINEIADTKKVDEFIKKYKDALPNIKDGKTLISHLQTVSNRNTGTTKQFADLIIKLSKSNKGLEKLLNNPNLYAKPNSVGDEGAFHWSLFNNLSVNKIVLELDHFKTNTYDDVFLHELIHNLTTQFIVKDSDLFNQNFYNKVKELYSVFDNYLEANKKVNEPLLKSTKDDVKNLKRLKEYFEFLPSDAIQQELLFGKIGSLSTVKDVKLEYKSLENKSKQDVIKELERLLSFKESRIQEIEKGDKDYYYFNSKTFKQENVLSEFLATFMNDANFREQLKNIDYKNNKSIFQSIIDLISEFIGLTKNDSLYNEFVLNLTNFINNNDYSAIAGQTQKTAYQNRINLLEQQKQQAQQLYSNFLSNFVDNNFDTIIQDLQTKNILDKKCS